MRKCNNCFAEIYRKDSLFCIRCGIRLCDADSIPAMNPCTHPHRNRNFTDEDEQSRNICVNHSCARNEIGFVFPDYAMHCDVCGCKTTYKRRR